MILVTGAAGFLGRSVVARLRRTNADVLAVARRDGSDAECDLSNPGAVSRLLAERQPDVIVNLAAIADFSNGALPRLYSVNTLCPAIMAEWCARTQAYLIHASMAVHGRSQTSFGPETPGAPETDYGRSKWLADRLIAASGCAGAVIRYGGIFGSGGPAHLGLNRAIDGARRGQRPTIVGSGATRRNYLHVDDAAEAIAVCVKERPSGVFYSGGEVQTMRGMLQAVCDVWLPGQQPIVEAGEDAPDQIIEVSPALGPFRSFRDALESCR